LPHAPYFTSLRVSFVDFRNIQGLALDSPAALGGVIG
jgi:hypothetical protein